MARREKLGFTAIRTEGGLLPPSILQRIHRLDLALSGLTPEDYGLSGTKIREAASQAWNALQGPWRAFQAERAQLADNEAATGMTRRKWLDQVLKVLDYGAVDLAPPLRAGDRTFAISHLYKATPMHLIGCGLDLEKRTKGAAGAASASPHGIVQLFLNVDDSSLWGFLSNGLRWRVLRDSVSLSRLSYVEFDLEAILEGQLYDEFLLFWLVCHQTRVKADRPEECWLEKWHQAAGEEGKRALTTLRSGVEKAIEALGQGFLRHPENKALRERIRAGELDKQDYYRQLLRMVYRLLFLFVAEDRGLLLHPNAPESTKRLFTENYGTQRIRQVAESLRGSRRYHDLFVQLKLVIELLGRPEGCPELGLPALGGFLFSEGSCPDLDSAELSNADLLEAIRFLAVTQEGGRRSRVDYKNLASEEMGSVYESLLELHPDLRSDGSEFKLGSASGNERKTTGSYYTPDSLIQCLLDTALEPVVADALKRAGSDAKAREAAILDLKVIDPAVGSGHFLIAAAHRLAKRLAQVRSGEDEPSPEVTRHALRDVIGRCLYGIDLNPMAAELCKVALWMEALEPGKPLSFLDHHIVVGNSLLGTTPDLIAQGIPDGAYDAIEGDDKQVCTLLKKQNKQERDVKQGNLFDPQAFAGKDMLAAWQEIESIPDDQLDEIRRKEKTFRQAEAALGMRKLIADAWCAAFTLPKTPPKPNEPWSGAAITTNTIRRLLNGAPLQEFEQAAVEAEAQRFGFLHPHLAFPGVFASGGFDLVVGNPPWKMPEQDARLAGEDQPVETELSESIQLKRERAFYTKSGCFPLSAKNRLQLARLFAERFFQLCGGTGAVAIIVPSTITVNAFDRPLWSSWVRGQHLASVWDFYNQEKLFADVDQRFKFCILHLTKEPKNSFYAQCWMTHPQQIKRDKNELVMLDETLLSRYSGAELALPHFTHRRDLRLLEDSIHRFGRVIDSETWQPEYILLASTADKDFVKGKKLASIEDDTESVEFIPVYEGKMVGIFDHRVARVVWRPGNAKRRAQEEALSPDQKADVTQLATALHVVPVSLLQSRDPHLAEKGWSIALCDVTSALNERTALAAIVPRCFTTHNLPLVRVCAGDPSYSAMFVAALGSFVFDFFCRIRVATNHLTEGIFSSLPVPSPQHLADSCLLMFGSQNWLVPRVLELSYTAVDLVHFANDLGYDGPPFIWDDERRFWLRAELDAAFFHLYGIDRDDVDYIMETFPIVKRKDIAAHGSYRTKEAILSIYDEMAEAMK